MSMRTTRLATSIEFETVTQAGSGLQEVFIDTLDYEGLLILYPMLGLTNRLLSVWPSIKTTLAATRSA